MIAKCEVIVPYLENSFIYIFCSTMCYIPNKMGKLHNSYTTVEYIIIIIYKKL